ncbi:hypothetical protein ACFYOD_18440 [Streptomyces sp. NPDC006703]|uniref:hypothetical protein n=1 Tax=Streptomyces sp. NPDC006703 TaxID=3364759 RepID=UPI0036A0D3A6
MVSESEHRQVRDAANGILHDVGLWTAAALREQPLPPQGRALKRIEELNRLFTELTGRLDALQATLDERTAAASFNGRMLTQTWDPQGRTPMDAHFHARALARQVQTLAEAYEAQIIGVWRRLEATMPQEPLPVRDPLATTETEQRMTSAAPSSRPAAPEPTRVVAFPWGDPSRMFVSYPDRPAAESQTAGDEPPSGTPADPDPA